MCTFIFVMVAMVSKYDPANSTKDSYLSSFGVSMGYYAMLFISTPYTGKGSALNSAIAMAQAAYLTLQTENPNHIYSQNLSVYIFGPIIGAILAGFCFKLHCKALEKIGHLGPNEAF
mmetsp:Transcript_45484/g.61708  ORF Transcript_45484/g.61708 Transcript_45484/m.61708 type:complete len:117 (-) Transcript_45484:92-442(-)